MNGLLFSRNAWRRAISGIRLFAIAVAAVGLSKFGISDAFAADVNTVKFASQGAAYSTCVADVQEELAYRRSIDSTYNYAAFPCDLTTPGTSQTDYMPFYSCRVYRTFSGSEFQCRRNTALRYAFPNDAQCAKAPILHNVAWQGGGTFCSSGCVYEPDDVPSSPNAFTFGIKDKSITQAKRLRPTGQTCDSLPTDSPQPKEDVCVENGTLTQCVTQDGRSCAKSSSGKLFCWDPNERGTKTSGNEASTKVSFGQTPNPPPVPPKNGGDWQNTGEASMSITDNRTNTTNNYTTNNWNSNYGSSGSGAGGGGSSGEGNGGSGDGSGEGSGEGEGEGEGSGPGGPGSGVGDLYSSEGKTVAGVFGEFKARVGESPLISAIRDFFTVNAGGACPVFTLSASTYWESMTYDGHCSGDFLAALRAIGWVLMAIAALAAAYWALS